MNNVQFLHVGAIPYELISHGSNIFPIVLQLLQDAKHPFDEKKGRIYFKIGGKLVKFDKETNIDSEITSIVYSEVVAPQGSAYYDEIDGIMFFFHPGEKSHQSYPHVHASYSGETISISLTNFHLTGHFKNRKKTKIAIEYVKENQDALLLAWSKTTGYSSYHGKANIAPL